MKDLLAVLIWFVTPTRPPSLATPGERTQMVAATGVWRAAAARCRADMAAGVRRTLGARVVHARAAFFGGAA